MEQKIKSPKSQVMLSTRETQLQNKQTSSSEMFPLLKRLKNILSKELAPGVNPIRWIPSKKGKIRLKFFDKTLLQLRLHKYWPSCLKKKNARFKSGQNWLEIVISVTKFKYYTREIFNEFNLVFLKRKFPL